MDISIGGIYFIPFFIFLWLLVTTTLGAATGWYTLMRKYPNRPEEVPVLRYKLQSGYMANALTGWMNRILKIEACRAGLRVGILRIFGPFCKDFFVPWSEIKVERKVVWMMNYAELSFGEGTRLGIDGIVADAIWRAIPESWPETGNAPEPVKRDDLKFQMFKFWLLYTFIASAFFTIAPRLMGAGEALPLFPPIIFAAVFMAFVSTYEYFRRSRLNK